MLSSRRVGMKNVGGASATLDMPESRVKRKTIRRKEFLAVGDER